MVRQPLRVSVVPLAQEASYGQASHTLRVQGQQKTSQDTQLANIIKLSTLRLRDFKVVALIQVALQLQRTSPPQKSKKNFLLNYAFQTSRVTRGYFALLILVTSIYLCQLIASPSLDFHFTVG